MVLRAWVSDFARELKVAQPLGRFHQQSFLFFLTSRMRITTVGGRRKMEVALNAAKTCQELCEAVTNEWGVSAQQQRLVWRGKRLSKTDNLQQLGLTDDDELVLHSKLDGGCGLGCGLCGANAECCCTLM